MAGKFTIEYRANLPGGGHAVITDTSPVLDIDPLLDGERVLREDGGLLEPKRETGELVWTGRSADGLTGRATWEWVS